VTWGLTQKIDSLSINPWFWWVKKIVRPKLKAGGGGFFAHMYAYNVFVEKIWCFGSLWMFKNS
jgi:hypothetical protein